MSSREIEKARAEYRNTHPLADIAHLLSDDELAAVDVMARMEAALRDIAGFQRSRPTGAAGSYQRGYDIGFNNAGLVAAGIAQAALPSTSEPLTVLEGEKGSARELARGPEALTVGETSDMVRWKFAITLLREAGHDPTDAPYDDLRALIGERDVLKQERDEALRLMSQYAREAGEAKGRLEMSEAVGIVDGWRERAEAAEKALKHAILGLSLAANTFRDYARLHRAKGSPEGDEKAARNDEMAAVCERAMRLPPSPLDPAELGPGNTSNPSTQGPRQ